MSFTHRQIRINDTLILICLRVNDTFILLTISIFSMLLMIGIGLVGEFERLFYGARELKNMKGKDKRKITKRMNTIKIFFLLLFSICLTEERTEGHYSIRSESSIFLKSLANQRKCV